MRILSASLSVLWAALAVFAPGAVRADDVASLEPAAARATDHDTAAAVALELSDTVEDGEHWRLDNENGVVHVWRPAGYDPATAGTVIYLHGHRATADISWVDHKMAAQFKDSGMNALFLVPDSTTDGEEELHWESLGALVRDVSRRTGVLRPSGPVVIMGHSGAFRNIAAWLGDNTIDHLILLDALYSHEDDFYAWITGSRGHEHKSMTLVSKDTRRNALRFMRRIKASVGIKEIPATWAKVPKKKKDAQILNLRSQYDHMGIVTSGVVIPLVLQRTALPPVRQKPRKSPDAVSLADTAGPG